jgi:hypothetical protein
MECKHCKFIEKLSKYLLDCSDHTNREYWILTEVFVHLREKIIVKLKGGGENERI